MGTIRLQPLDGVWQTLGTGLFAGIEPHNIRPTWGANGPDTLAFDLQADPHQPNVELAEFTPVDFEGDGLDPAWSGFLMDTPASEGYAVQALGWNHALDFAKRSLFYVHNQLGDWKDMRSFLTAVLGVNAALAAGTVTTDQGILLSFPNNTPITAGSCVGVILDLGPGREVKRLVMNYETSNNTSTINLYARSQSTPSQSSWGTASDAIAGGIGLTTMGASGTIAGSFSTPHRYVNIFIYYGGGATTTGADHWARLTSIACGAETTYISSAASTLVASTVFKAERAKNAFLRADDTRIATTTTTLPMLGGVGEVASTKVVLDRVNSYHSYRWGVDPDTRLYFQPQPAVPELSVNTDDDGVAYEDASRNSGQEEYNEVLITGQTGAGEPLVVQRNATALGTILNRRGLTRTLEITPQVPMDATTMAIVGDLNLSRTSRPPMKGSLSITGAAVFDTATGRHLRPVEVAARAGELIRLADIADPYSGHIGRDVLMVSASLNDDTGEVTVSLDEDRGSFDALMNRFGLFGNQTA